MDAGLEVQYDEDDNPIVSERDMRTVGALAPLEHGAIEYAPFSKDFYEEHAQVAPRPPARRDARTYESLSLQTDENPKRLYCVDIPASEVRSLGFPPEDHWGSPWKTTGQTGSSVCPKERKRALFRRVGQLPAT